MKVPADCRRTSVAEYSSRSLVVSRWSRDLPRLGLEHLGILARTHCGHSHIDRESSLLLNPSVTGYSGIVGRGGAIPKVMSAGLLIGQMTEFRSHYWPLTNLAPQANGPRPFRGVTTSYSRSLESALCIFRPSTSSSCKGVRDMPQKAKM
jgi:hypothetical protein